MKLQLLLTALGFAARVLGNCAHGTSLFPRKAEVTVSTFGYNDLQGPLNWFGLNTSANAACSEGSNQSPIVLNSSISTVSGSSFNLTIPDYPQGAVFENLGTNVEVVVNGSLSYGGIQYPLAQFHFHTPAEHRINSEFYPMEIHFVFETTAKQIAVIGALIELCLTDCAEPLFTSVFSRIDRISQPGNETTSAALQFQGFIDKLKAGSFYAYTGSLTTPPCSESVAWLVSQSLFYIDLPTWLSVKSVIKFNARYTQDSLGEINLLKNAGEVLSNNNGLRK